MANGEAGHVNDMQRYLVEEEAEKWQDGRITRREFVRRATLIRRGAQAGSRNTCGLSSGVMEGPWHGNF